MLAGLAGEAQLRLQHELGAGRAQTFFVAGVWRDYARQTGREDIGLLLAESFDIGQLGLLGLVMAESASRAADSNTSSKACFGVGAAVAAGSAAEAGADGGHPFGRLRAVQLQKVRIEGFDDLGLFLEVALRDEEGKVRVFVSRRLKAGVEVGLDEGALGEEEDEDDDD